MKTAHDLEPWVACAKPAGIFSCLQRHGRSNKKGSQREPSLLGFSAG